MQLFGNFTLSFLVLHCSMQTLQIVTACTSTADCAQDETCVAGDSDTVAQECVRTPVCGGSSPGNCPTDGNGQLVCLWRPFDGDCSEGCAMLHGNKGIYKCLSLSRCDSYHGGTSCSDGCSVNGTHCNGQGLCNLVSGPNEAPAFTCTCQNGYTGDKCEAGPESTPSTINSDIAPMHSAEQTEPIYNFDLSNKDSISPPGEKETNEPSNTPSTGDVFAKNVNVLAPDISEGISAHVISTAIRDPTETSSSGSLKGVVIGVLVLTEIIVIGTIALAQRCYHKKQQEMENANPLYSSHMVQ